MIRLIASFSVAIIVALVPSSYARAQCPNTAEDPNCAGLGAIIAAASALPTLPQGADLVPVVRNVAGALILYNVSPALLTSPIVLNNANPATGAIVANGGIATIPGGGGSYATFASDAAATTQPNLAFNWATLAGLADVTASSGHTAPNTTGVLGVAINSASNAVTNAVGVFGLGQTKVGTTNNAVWGGNTVAESNAGDSGTHALWGFETDVNSFSANDSAIGLQVAGVFGAGQLSSAEGIQIQAAMGSIGGARWQQGIEMLDGCCITAIDLPVSQASGSSLPSAPINFRYRNASGIDQSIAVEAVPLNGLVVQGTPGSSGQMLTIVGETWLDGPVRAGGGGGTVGVTCAAGTMSVSTMQTTNGIITHC